MTSPSSFKIGMTPDEYKQYVDTRVFEEYAPVLALYKSEVLKSSGDNALKILAEYSSEDMFRLLDFGVKMELGSLYSRILDLFVPQSMTKTELIMGIMNHVQLYGETQEMFNDLTFN